MRARHLLVELLLGLSLAGCGRDWDSFEFTEGQAADSGTPDAPNADVSQGDSEPPAESGADAPSIPDATGTDVDSGPVGCTPPTADCNGIAADGCEVDLSTSMQHCGACSSPCPATPDHASATCMGQCVLSCESGFADCDRNLANGCEAPAQDYAAVVIADQPVGYWRLGEKSGATGADASGNGSTLTYVNGPLLGMPGAAACDPDSAVRFQSSKSSRATMPRNATVDPKSAITIEYWVKEEAPLKAGAKHLWYGDSNAMTVPGSCWGFERDPSDSDILRGNIKLDAGGFGLGCKGCVQAGVWTHVALTYDGANVTLYVNGVAKIKHAIASPPACTGSAGLAIGASNIPDNYADATIDEVAIYDKALTGAQLVAHYQAGL